MDQNPKMCACVFNWICDLFQNNKSMKNNVNKDNKIKNIKKIIIPG